MGDIALSFKDMEPAEAEHLLAAYKAIKAGQTFHHQGGVSVSGETPTFHTPGVNHWPLKDGTTGGYSVEDPAPRAHEAPQPVHYTVNEIHPNAQNATAVPPTGQVSVTVDAAGLPWVDGTHSSSRKQNADGSWSLRKGCPEALGKAYKDEFRRRLNQAGVTAPAVQPQAPSPAALNHQFGAPPVHSDLPSPGQGYPAPAIDYETWKNQYIAVLPRLNQASFGEIMRQSGVTTVGDYALPDNGLARQIGYSLLKQLELQ
jgi:hypothetical protein